MEASLPSLEDVVLGAECLLSAGLSLCAWECLFLAESASLVLRPVLSQRPHSPGHGVTQRAQLSLVAYEASLWDCC